MASNPFVTSTAVRAHNLFFGRQEEIKQLFAAISADPPQNCSVIGLPKSGKSSLLMTLTNEEYQGSTSATHRSFCLCRSTARWRTSMRPPTYIFA